MGKRDNTTIGQLACNAGFVHTIVKWSLVNEVRTWRCDRCGKTFTEDVE